MFPGYQSQNLNSTKEFWETS